MTSMPGFASASAPASIGNVGVGFDVLGLAFDAVRDRVTAHREPGTGIQLGEVSGLVDNLPSAVEENCALAAAQSVLGRAGAQAGLRIDVEKGVPLSAGMGGSAASAVAAAGAVNALLGHPLTVEDVLLAAMDGERVSADPPPWDNVMASLYGGLVIAAQLDPPLIRPLPLPRNIDVLLFHPERRTETQAARDLLADQVDLPVAVDHARNIAGFIAGCAMDDHDLIRSGLRDILIEPQRLPLLPELATVQSNALDAGALGCSFSGSGPSVFAWVETQQRDSVVEAMRAAFDAADCPADLYQAPLDSAGLRIETAPAEALA